MRYESKLVLVLVSLSLALAACGSAVPPGSEVPDGAPGAAAGHAHGEGPPHAHGDHAHGHEPDAASAAGPLVAPGETKVGDRTKCMVSGDEFVVSATSPAVEHAGKTYHFCCAHCVEAFRKNPAAHLHGD